MEIFDTHFHYYGESSPKEFNANIAAALQLTPQRELGTFDRFYLNALGGDYIESCRAREFAQQTADAFFCAGVHPHQAEAYYAEKPDFSEFRNHPKLIGIGELGLDYYYESSPRNLQQKMLDEFLALALEWDLPAVIHLRDKDDIWQAYEDGYAQLKNFAAAGGRFEIHCFAGTPAWAEKFLELGAYLGVTGAVTFRRADNIRETVEYIPADRLLVETDSPYLAPVPHRGSENQPAFVTLVAAKVAEVKAMPLEECAAVTTENGLRFFNIKREA